MSPVQFYRWSLFLPICFPILAFPFIGGRHTEALIPAIAPAAMFILLVATFGALPYMTIAVPFAIWMGEKSIREIRRAFLITPLILCGLVTIFILTINGWDTLLSRQTSKILLLGTGISLGLGYLWIAPILWIGRNLEKRLSRIV